MKGTRLLTIDTNSVDKVGAKVTQVKEKDMKRFKKLSALMLAAVMVLAMALPAFAAPSSADTGTIKVTGVEDGATVKAVRIVEPVYGENDTNLNGYKFADKYAKAAEELGLKVDNLKEELTPDAVSKLFATIAKGDFTIDLTGDKAAGYTAKVPAGLYMVYIVGTTDDANGKVSHNIYNPLVVALAYDDTKAGTDTTLVSGEYDFGVADTAEAKHTTTDAGKKFTGEVQNAHADTVKVGDTITWELYADVPTWNSDAYKKLTFRMTDTMKAGTFEDVRGYVVKDKAGNVIDASNYTLKEEATDKNLTFVIDMNDAWLRDPANQGQKITVTYQATLAKGASTGFDPNTNEFKLQYSHDPSFNPDEEPLEDEPLEEIEEKTNNYTVDIAFFKYDEATGKALEGAGFTLYADKECTQVVKTKEGDDNGEVMSKADGSFGFTGLDAKTYYMKETKTPAGYAATDEVYEVVIESKVDDTETIKVYDMYINDAGERKVVDEFFDPAKHKTFKKTTKEHTAELLEYTTTVKNKAGKEVGKLTVKKAGEASDGVIVVGKTLKIDLTKDFAARICNTKIPQLPSTGGMGTYLFTIAGVALIAVAAFMLISKRRNVTE